MVKDFEDQSSEEYNNAIEGLIIYTEAAIQFKKGLIYLLKQHDTNSMDVNAIETFNE